MIHPFWWPGITPAPPTMYTQELSFLEMVGALTAKLNEVIKEVNRLGGNVPAAIDNPDKTV